jgi:putative flippase GtrA
MVFFRYLVSGSTATLVHFAVLVILVELFDVSPIVASILGFCAAIGANYTLQYYWTFQATGTHQVLFARYVTVTLVMLIVNTSLFWALNGWLQIQYLLAQAGATAIVVLLNYKINKHYTFST